MRAERGASRTRTVFLAFVMASFLATLWGCGDDGGLMTGLPVAQPPALPNPPTTPPPPPP